MINSIEHWSVFYRNPFCCAIVISVDSIAFQSIFWIHMYIVRECIIPFSRRLMNWMEFLRHSKMPHLGMFLSMIKIALLDILLCYKDRTNESKQSYLLFDSIVIQNLLKECIGILHTNLKTRHTNLHQPIQPGKGLNVKKHILYSSKIR